MAIRLVVRGPSNTDAKADIAFEFDQQRVVIGRGTGVDVRLPKGTVSDHHATMRVESHGVVIVDESSTNGTFVEGLRLVPGRAKLLRDGDVIRISTFQLIYQATAMPLSVAPSVERTTTLARRMLREMLDPVGFASKPVELVVTTGPNEGQRFHLPPPPARVVIGRSENAEFSLTDAETSREHVEVIRDSEGTLLRDLDSKNGIRINDKPLREKRLRDRDEIAFGNTVLTFVDPADATMRAMEGMPDEKLDETPVAEPTPAALVSPMSAEPASLPVVDAAPKKKALTKKSSALRTDVFVYAFAGVVLLASAIALFVLLRAR